MKAYHLFTLRFDGVWIFHRSVTREEIPYWTMRYHLEMQDFEIFAW